MRYLCLLLLLIGLVACSSRPAHPLHGKWKLTQVADSVVAENPIEITMEFFPDGKIKRQVGDELIEAEYIVSEDTSRISIIEKGKLVVELDIARLDGETLLLRDESDPVWFTRVK